MLNRVSSNYPEELLKLRRAKKLHTTVENRLVELLGEAAPDYHPLKEPQGLAGGRNDLMLFEFSGRRVVFEIFATHSQVSRDLLILHKTKADVKIAILIDKDVDEKVFEKYLRENPDEPFPFLFIGELFEDPPDNCHRKLGELISRDEEATFQPESFLDREASSQKVSLQVWNGQFVCAVGGGGGEVLANRSEIDEWATLDLIELESNKIGLRASNGDFICAEGGGGHELFANRKNLSRWETFELVELGDDKVALRTYSGQYVCAENGGGREVIANRNVCLEWETFRLIRHNTAPLSSPFVREQK